MSLRCCLAERLSLRPTNDCLGPRLSLDVVCTGVLFEARVKPGQSSPTGV